jgi:hypothetical protein
LVLGSLGRRKDSSKKNALCVQEKWTLFAHCIKRFRADEGEEFFGRKWFIIKDEGAYKGKIKHIKAV